MAEVLGAGRVLLGRYRLEREIGRGGMGVVFEATDLEAHELRAVKLLTPEGVGTDELHARFLREGHAVVGLRSEHVARVFEVGVLLGNTPYLVMEYLHGHDLAVELARRGRLFPWEAVDHVVQACEAISEAHAYGVIHRDIKPANLFLTARRDGSPMIKVLDFGIAKTPGPAGGTLTSTDAVMGTTGYMSPEQMRASRDVDARSDVWAFGIVLYELLTGRRPFDAASSLAIAMLVATSPPPPMERWVKKRLQAVVLKCLEKEPHRRYGSVVELVHALAPFARDRRTVGVVISRAKLMRRGWLVGDAAAPVAATPRAVHAAHAVMLPAPPVLDTRPAADSARGHAPPTSDAAAGIGIATTVPAAAQVVRLHPLAPTLRAGAVPLPGVARRPPYWLFGLGVLAVLAIVLVMVFR